MDEKVKKKRKKMLIGLVIDMRNLGNDLGFEMG